MFCRSSTRTLEGEIAIGKYGCPQSLSEDLHCALAHLKGVGELNHMHSFASVLDKAGLAGKIYHLHICNEPSI